VKDIDFGKFYMPIIITLLLTLTGTWVYVYVLQTEIKIIESQKILSDGMLELANKRILDNKTEYEENLKIATIRNETLKKDFETKIKNIKKWEVKNVSCEDAVKYVDDYQF